MVEDCYAAYHNDTELAPTLGRLLDQRRVVAVQPKPSFLPFFEKQRQKAPEPAGVNDGSDGGLSMGLPPDDYGIEVWGAPPKAPGS